MIDNQMKRQDLMRAAEKMCIRDSLTTRDQRMMFAVITMVITADSKEQLENDTEALLTTCLLYTSPWWK